MDVDITSGTDPLLVDGFWDATSQDPDVVVDITERLVFLEATGRFLASCASVEWGCGWVGREFDESTNNKWGWTPKPPKQPTFTRCCINILQPPVADGSVVTARAE